MPPVSARTSPQSLQCTGAYKRTPRRQRSQCVPRRSARHVFRPWRRLLRLSGAPRFLAPCTRSPPRSTAGVVVEQPNRRPAGIGQCASCFFRRFLEFLPDRLPRAPTLAGHRRTRTYAFSGRATDHVSSLKKPHTCRSSSTGLSFAGCAYRLRQNNRYVVTAFRRTFARSSFRTDRNRF